MATPQIGPKTCFDIRTRPPEIEEAVEFTEVPGYDGVEAESIGLRGGPFSIVAVQIGTHAEIEAWIAALKAFSGDAPVTITTGDGAVFDNCYIGGPDGMGVVVQVKRPGLDGSGTLKWKCEVLVSGHRSAT